MILGIIIALLICTFSIASMILVQHKKEIWEEIHKLINKG